MSVPVRHEQAKINGRFRGHTGSLQSPPPQPLLVYRSPPCAYKSYVQGEPISDGVIPVPPNMPKRGPGMPGCAGEGAGVGETLDLVLIFSYFVEACFGIET